MLSERCRLSSRWNDEVDEFIARTKSVIEAGLLLGIILSQ
jgi:hypothetical protein